MFSVAFGRLRSIYRSFATCRRIMFRAGIRKRLSGRRTKQHLLLDGLPWIVGEVADDGAQLTRTDGEPLRMRPSMTVWPVQPNDRTAWNTWEGQLGGIEGQWVTFLLP